MIYRLILMPYLTRAESLWYAWQAYESGFMRRQQGQGIRLLCWPCLLLCLVLMLTLRQSCSMFLNQIWLRH